MKKLFLDIETSPNVVYAWGLWGQNIGINQIVEPGRTLCWAAAWENGDTVQFRSVHHDTYEAMVQGIHALLSEADMVVHYNGTKFDIPTLNREFLMQDLGPPQPFHQVDLFKVVKKRFRFVSNKLDFVCQQLGLGAKEQHKGMGLWHDCMAGDNEAWSSMKSYNIQDVKLLPTLYNKLLPWIQDHPNAALFNSDVRPMCTNCGSTNVVKKGLETTKVGLYQRYKCTDCGTPLRGRTQVPQDKAKKEGVLTQSKL